MGMPNLAPAHQVQQQPSYEMMRTAGAPPSQTFIAVPSANLVQASHPMVGGQGYTMRLSDNVQSSVSSNTSSMGYSSVGQSVMTTSPSYATSKFTGDEGKQESMSLPINENPKSWTQDSPWLL